VLMRVSFACRPGGIVLVLMMLVVHMCVSMSQRLVFVLVAVVFGHMEHDAYQHQDTKQDEGRLARDWSQMCGSRYFRRAENLRPSFAQYGNC
jgi:hypothetical protein